jgi:hypothetical protein
MKEYICVCVCVCWGGGAQIQTLFWYILSLLNPLRMKINLQFLSCTKHTHQLQKNNKLMPYKEIITVCFEICEKM